MNLPLDTLPDLVKKYDRPGPRYTSYPTAPQWSSGFGPQDYREALLRGAAPPDERFALYIHIPFCEERCHYCGCNVVISKKPDIVDAFLEHIALELALVAGILGEKRGLVQMHWGGGTPTYLSVDQIGHLFDRIGAHFHIDPDTEIAIEVDPRVTSEEQIRCLRNFGFNRISLGVQDLDPGVQQAIGRNQTEEQTRTLYEYCREQGFTGINFDLIYGLPGQTLAGWEQCIRSIIEMAPDRLAVYSYAHLPENIKHQAKIDAAALPSAEAKSALIALARRLLVDAGYNAIGMDHFARPGDELCVASKDGRLHRNFMGYTTIADTQMIGIGPSAISFVGSAYAQNEKRLFKYYRALDNAELPTAAGMALTQDDLIRRWTIEQLMCNFRLSFQELADRFDIDFDTYFAEEAPRLDELQRDGFLRRSEDSIAVLPLGEP
ncbi:MAG: oxygen-independent coproporphyrinogen III oxidase, partial [Planctomycetes bacterium]|nr:oxygen-independent coproporphyrinogen III oxidase [Planctomycetota bacterium]